MAGRRTERPASRHGAFTAPPPIPVSQLVQKTHENAHELVTVVTSDFYVKKDSERADIVFVFSMLCFFKTHHTIDPFIPQSHPVSWFVC